MHGGTLRPQCASRGDLLEALTTLDNEEDVNKILKYFSYEHFYVIYCKVCGKDSHEQEHVLLRSPDLLSPHIPTHGHVTLKYHDQKEYFVGRTLVCSQSGACASGCCSLETWTYCPRKSKGVCTSRLDVI